MKNQAKEGKLENGLMMALSEVGTLGCEGKEKAPFCMAIAESPNGREK